MTEFRPFQQAVAADPALSHRIRDFLGARNPALANLPAPAPQSPAQATPPAAQADEPGPAAPDGTTHEGPVAGPGSAQDPAPGAPLEDAPPVTPPAGGGSAETPGAAGDPPGDVVTPEEIAAEFGPGPAVEHTSTGGPMAPCQQPESHGVWCDGRGVIPAQCDVPEHHEDAPAANAPDGAQ